MLMQSQVFLLLLDIQLSVRNCLFEGFRSYSSRRGREKLVHQGPQRTLRIAYGHETPQEDLHEKLDQSLSHRSKYGRSAEVGTTLKERQSMSEPGSEGLIKLYS